MASLPYIVAEIGSVHDGSFGNACRLIEEAAASGADAVKFQTHIADAESLASAPSPPYFSEEPRVEYFRRTAFSLQQWKELATVAQSTGIDFLSSPFSLEAVELLEKVGISAYKIPSGEVTNIPMLEKIVEIKKPVYLSSGMSNWDELDLAVDVLRGGGELTIMQCSSLYPCPEEKVGLNVIPEMRSRYNLSVGFSDHTLGLAASLAAVTLGAVVIEKHFTFSRYMYGSDAKHSMEPKEFANFCNELKSVGKMINSSVDKDDLSPYIEMKKIFEKSVVTSQALKAGTILKKEHFAFKKPGDGISAAEYRQLLGRRVRVDLAAEHKLGKTDIE